MEGNYHAFFLDGRESGSERIPCGLLRGNRANGEHYYSIWIEDSPLVAAESFKRGIKKFF